MNRANFHFLLLGMFWKSAPMTVNWKACENNRCHKPYCSIIALWFILSEFKHQWGSLYCCGCLSIIALWGILDGLTVCKKYVFIHTVSIKNEVFRILLQNTSNLRYFMLLFLCKSYLKYLLRSPSRALPCRASSRAIS